MWPSCARILASIAGLIALGSITIGATAAVAGNPPSQSAPTVEPTGNGLVVTAGAEVIQITVCDDTVIHIVTAHGADIPQGASPAQPWMLKSSTFCPGAKFDLSKSPDGVSLSTAKLRVTFEYKGDNLVYSTIDGQQLLLEREKGPRTYEEGALNGTRVLTVEDRFMPDMKEGIYGLGQHQSGLFNYRGATVELGQNNTDIAIPLLVSTKGYGLLWNTASLTYFDNRYPPVYSLRALDADAIDYYFIYGPEMDDIIHHYREMTGHALLFPLWAYGFFQSKDAYESQDEVLGIARRYRSEEIPLDCIVQDGGWWKVWGDLPFRPTYPDVNAMLRELHAEHVHTMISVWGLYGKGSTNLEAMRVKGWLVPGTEEYDATNPETRDFFWKSLPGPLLAQGWDSFWLDADEPDAGPHEGDVMLLDKNIAIGKGTMYTNVFPLLHTGGIADHWRETTSDKRVLLLTRSAFMGEQRNGVVLWSGDVYPTNWAFQHQIVAGLNFALSGFPYWTTDVAGYWALDNDPSMTNPEYQELYARWFEFGAFCPIFRTHGHRPHNEVWTFDKVTPALVTYDRLRYRLMPYIYSLAWKVTHDDYTMQRPLVMDWRTDHRVWNIGDEYMFGPAFLVSPVWQEGARKREVYLPEAAAWYDFWTGRSFQSRQQLNVNAPVEKLPLFIRAGSIIPMGPEIDYADQKPDGPIEIRIYRGANGSFNLYEDEGDSYRYDQGAYAVIPLHWDDASRTLTFGERAGTFTGMAQQMTFRVVLVGPDHGVGESVSPRVDALVKYVGKSQTITFPANRQHGRTSGN